MSNIDHTGAAESVPRPRVALLGGTFDPPHIGHLSLAVHAREALAVDRVDLVVAHTPWQKEGQRHITAAEHRLAMVRLAVAGIDGLAASTVEIDRGGPTFTIDTVRDYLAGDDLDIVLIVGADAAAGLDTWHQAEELATMVEVAVADRPGSDFDVASSPLGEHWVLQSFVSPALDISSSQMRARALEGRSLDVLVPSAVVDYIGEHDLYSGGAW